MESHVHGF
jgi:hypothetical protein